MVDVARLHKIEQSRVFLQNKDLHFTIVQEAMLDEMSSLITFVANVCDTVGSMVPLNQKIFRFFCPDGMEKALPGEPEPDLSLKIICQKLLIAIKGCFQFAVPVADTSKLRNQNIITAGPFFLFELLAPSLSVILQGLKLLRNIHQEFIE